MRYESIRLFFSAKVFRQATFWRRCVPAAPSERLFGVAACQPGPSSDFLASLRASGSVKRLFGVAACQRVRQATFWRRCVPAGPSSDFLAPLRASGSVMRHFGEPACQRLRHATFWGACMPAAPSCDILGRLCASGSVMRHFGSTFDPAGPVSELPAIERRSAPASTAAPLYIKV